MDDEWGEWEWREEPPLPTLPDWLIAKLFQSLLRKNMFREPLMFEDIPATQSDAPVATQ